MKGTGAENSCPLCVDLDGTLIAGDMLWESALLLCRHRPLCAMAMPMWLLGEKANLKNKIAAHVSPNAASLPYRENVIEFVRRERSGGRRVVLATASNARVAQAVADHLGIFDEVIASDAQSNYAGNGKLEVLRQKFAESGFEYVGDSFKDMPVWEEAKRAYVVGPSRRLRGAVEKRCKNVQVLEAPRDRFRGMVRALRPTQWVKNVLVFLPLILAHVVQDEPKLVNTVIAFFAFCLCASAIYVVNDLLDLESDRMHPRKKKRPFASGALSVPMGLGIVTLLVPASMAMGWLVGIKFLGLLVAYLFLTSAYSMYVKEKLLLDVILLSYLYTHRILSGAAAAVVPVTPWLLAFSLFFFLSLAFAKRYSELVVLQGANLRQASGRSYTTDDLDVILSVGPACGYLSVLVFCLYIADGEATHNLYHHPKVLWMICPILLYWITRIWFFAKRRALVDDPVLFAVKDRVSWMAGLLSAALVAAATINW